MNHTLIEAERGDGTMYQVKDESIHRERAVDTRQQQVNDTTPIMPDRANIKRRIVLILENIFVFVATACMYPVIVHNQRLWADILRFFEENTLELDALKLAGHEKRDKGRRGDSKPSELARSVLLQEQKAGYQDGEENRAMSMMDK